MKYPKVTASYQGVGGQPVLGTQSMHLETGSATGIEAQVIYRMLSHVIFLSFTMVFGESQ